MDDLFEREQAIYNRAAMHLTDVRQGAPVDITEFEFLVREYGFALRQLRRFTRLSDRTTLDLNTRKLDLLDKVYYDTLTGAHSRRYMEEILARLLNEPPRPNGGKLSLIMLDVDFFKEYNDTYGHNMGDEALRSIAGAMRVCVTRPDDFIARYGGEEFAVILPHTEKAGALMIAERILESVRACAIPHAGNRAAPYLTASLGVTTGNIAAAESGEEFLRRADQALYMSKHQGRDRCTFLAFEEGDNAH